MDTGAVVNRQRSVMQRRSPPTEYAQLILVIRYVFRGSRTKEAHLTCEPLQSYFPSATDDRNQGKLFRAPLSALKPLESVMLKIFIGVFVKTKTN